MTNSVMILLIAILAGKLEKELRSGGGPSRRLTGSD